MNYNDLRGLSEDEMKARDFKLAPLMVNIANDPEWLRKRSALMVNAHPWLKSGDPIVSEGELYAYVQKPPTSPSWRDKLHRWLMWPYRRWPALLNLEMRIERWWK